MVEFMEVVERLKALPLSKWNIHEDRLAALLELDLEGLDDFLNQLRSGGSGKKKDGTFKRHPEPYNQSFDLASSVEKAALIWTPYLLEMMVLNSLTRIWTGSFILQSKWAILRGLCTTNLRARKKM